MATARTGSGDAGFTDLLGGRRVAKYDLIPEALGEVDEATSALGLAKACLPEGAPHDLARRALESAQHDLYQLMAELAFPPDHRQARRLSEADVRRIEAAIQQAQAAVALPNKFILPGGCRESAGLDLARAVVRRAERAVARVLHAGAAQQAGRGPQQDPQRGAPEYPSNPALVSYLNRLSLLLFVLARYEDVVTGATQRLAGQRP
jgi:cob(I)alamin adenosyltransferase